MVIHLILFLWTGLFYSGCLVNEQCHSSGDCENGICLNGECVTPDDLSEQQSGLQCPKGMVPVDERFCMDRYEASRPDADSLDQGVSDSAARVRPGVLPWHGTGYWEPVTFDEADSACRNAGKRLCTADEWQLACSGPDGSRYCYGDTYDPDRCNSIDAFDNTGESYHLVPTGSFPACTSWCGLYDISGNLWEWVQGQDENGNPYPHLRGGAYNCGTPGAPYYMLSCGFDGGTFRPAAGIRCCHDGWTH